MQIIIAHCCCIVLYVFLLLFYAAFIDTKPIVYGKVTCSKVMYDVAIRMLTTWTDSVKHVACVCRLRCYLWCFWSSDGNWTVINLNITINIIHNVLVIRRTTTSTADSLVIRRTTTSSADSNSSTQNIFASFHKYLSVLTAF